MMNYQVSAMKRRNKGNEFNNAHHLEPLNADSDPVEKLRFACLSRGINGILTLGRMFRKLDNDGSKNLGEEEFVKGLMEAGIEVSEDDAREVFHHFDPDGEGKISMDAFLAHIRPPMSESRKKMIEDCFKKLDVHGDGHITLADLKKVYSVKFHREYISGEEEEETLLKRFLANFEDEDPEDVIVTQEDFLNHYAGLCASGNSDSYFDLMMRRAFKL